MRAPFLVVLLLLDVRADDSELSEVPSVMPPEQQEYTHEQDMNKCTKAAPCWEHNLTACFEVHTRACWTYHSLEEGTLPCTQRDPCCADAHCWFRHAPEKGLAGNDFFTVWRVFAAASVIGLVIIVRDSVLGVTIFEYFKLMVFLNLLCFFAVPHPWFHALCIPFFPHPASSLKSLLSSSKLVLAFVGLRRFELLACAVFGANWRGRIRRIAQDPRGEGQGNHDGIGADGTTREQPTHWPPPLRVPKSVAARLQTDLAPPESFVCPLTLDLMREPAVTPRGTTYEREALTRWITAEGRYPSQEAEAQLGVEQLAPNLSVRNLIEAWLREQDGANPRVRPSSSPSRQSKAKKRSNAKA